MLSAEDFPAFFEEVYGHQPFPWQSRLLKHLANTGEWPKHKNSSCSVLDLPTGSGKTSTIDIAVFHLALEAGHGEARRAPVRIAFVVDRRLVVDDAYARARKIEDALRWVLLDESEADRLLADMKDPNTAVMLQRVRSGSVVRAAAHKLRELSLDGAPLLARRLRGGVPREDDWARTPSQPTVLCSTVDQVGSRLLFRGYGVTDRMKPVHAGLLGSDCLILLDEAHLAEPFRQTLGWVSLYRSRKWRESETASPWSFAILTATPGDTLKAGFELKKEDREHPILKKRLEASKPASLIAPAKSKKKSENEADSFEERKTAQTDLKHRAMRILNEVEKAIVHFEDADNGAACPAIAVVVNRVARARAVFEALNLKLKPRVKAGEVAEPILMIGPARPVERDDLARELTPIRTDAGVQDGYRALGKTRIIVATQCIEAGVDIDLDALITEAAPLDALRQRFGRLNRGGRKITPHAAIIAEHPDLSSRDEDPVYGKAIKATWDYLSENKADEVDFGIDAFDARLREAIAPADAFSPKVDAPVLLPAHLDLLSQTSPIPAADPDVALYLHGPRCEPDSVSVIWRADIEPGWFEGEDGRKRLIALLQLVPPRATEAIELPIWAVRRWLANRDREAADIADVPAEAQGEEEQRRPVRSGKGRVFRWVGDSDRSRWISPRDLRPGDTIVVPAAYGGVDGYGWKPESDDGATDVAQKASEPFAGRRFAVRLVPGPIVAEVSADRLADALANAEAGSWRDMRDALLDLPLPDDLRAALDKLSSARCKRGKPIVVAYPDVYGKDDRDRPRGIVFLAPLGRKDISGADREGASATEDDWSGSLPGFSQSLSEHSKEVKCKAEEFARAAGLSVNRVRDVKLSGFLHDAGKSDQRFQAFLNYGDPFGADLDNAESVLAKSGRKLPRSAWSGSSLPDHWRHEALSVRMAMQAASFLDLTKDSDPELILWLVGTHHGYGRPLFPHEDKRDQIERAHSSVIKSLFGLPDRLPAGAGPQSLAFDWNGLDWPSLFERLKARYGVWELARMEAILRLADHRASEEAERRTESEDEK